MLDLLVSVQTSLPDSHPRLTIRSTLPCERIWRLLRPEAAEYAPAETAFGDDAPSCFFARLATPAAGYAQMVHPSDAGGDTIDIHRDPSPAVRLGHRLFVRPLEKGVILRSRVRSVFFVERDVEAIAAECYREFAAGEPPMTT